MVYIQGRGKKNLLMDGMKGVRKREKSRMTTGFEKLEEWGCPSLRWEDSGRKRVERRD